jgi:hypothetical protein
MISITNWIIGLSVSSITAPVAAIELFSIFCHFLILATIFSCFSLVDIFFSSWAVSPVGSPDDIRNLSVLRQILGYAFSRWLHRVIALAPVGRADFSVFFRELKRVQHTQRFVDITAKRQVVDYGVSDHSFFVD